MSVFDFNVYKENHPVQLELVRFIDTIDVEDVVLENREDYKVIDSGEWVIPAGFGSGLNVTYARADVLNTGVTGDINSRDLTNVNAGANLARLSKMVWMEKGRSDAMEVGKISVISGHGVRAKTSVFKDGATFVEGGLLTIVKETANTVNKGRVVLAPASGSDVVKAVCLAAPTNSPDGLLFFELVD